VAVEKLDLIEIGPNLGDRKCLSASRRSFIEHPGSAKIAHDIRWNPELNEWFCALCGRTSDHATATDAIAELEVFECAMLGIIVRPMTREKRTNRANSKKIKLKD